MSSSFATGRNANVFLLCSPLNFNVIKHGCHLHTDCFAFSVMNYLSSSQALWAEAQRRHRLVLQRLQRSPGRGGPLGAVAEDKTQKHLETQDGPRGEDLGPAEGRRASNTDLQLCFMTLTPLYYRLKERRTEATRRGWWETHCGWGEGVENKLQTTEASSRFTKSSTARGDYNWDYWRHSVAAARQQVDRCQGGEESQGDTTEMTSLLPGLSVLEWSCCASVWVCECVSWMVHYSQAAPSSSSCMCHLLVFFSPLPTRVPLKRQPDTNCDIYGRAADPRGLAVGTRLGGGRFGLRGEDGHDRLETCFATFLCKNHVWLWNVLYTVLLLFLKRMFMLMRRAPLLPSAIHVHLKEKKKISKAKTQEDK